jgi:hypothetical protein
MKKGKMETPVLKDYLLNIANKVTEETTVEDAFEQFLMLLDIEESEKQIENGLVFSHEQVKEEASKLL